MSSFQFAYLALTIVAALSGAFGLLAIRRAAVARASLLTSDFVALLSLALWVWRWIAAGHLPLFGTFENALSVAAATLVAGAAFDARRRAVLAAPAASLFAAIVLAQGFAYDPAIYELTISERSLVVDLHAILAWLAFGVFAVNCALAARAAFTRDEKTQPFLESTLTLGFVLHTAMIATGSLYKFMLFGKAWSFDPIETMAFTAWLLYGTLLHMLLLAGWSARRFARWSIAAFVVLFVSYRAIVYFPPSSTYHVFDLDLKLHDGGSEEMP
jgi:ABC-type transport system involved in cytochrome c biogenesis permease subunit